MARAKEKKKRGGFGLFVLILLIIFALAYILASKVYVEYKEYNAVFDPLTTERYSINIPSGASTTRIAQILEESGIIEDAKRFKLKARLNELDGSFQAGDYHLSPSMSTEEIMKILQDGHNETVRFTIPEGYTIVQTAEKLVEDGMIASVDEFYDACARDWDYWFLKDVEAKDEPTGTVPAEANRLEGFLFPETYEVYLGATPKQIVQRMLDQFDEVFTPLWEAASKAQGTELVNGLTIPELVAAASLIERESKVAEDRPLIASVIYNRIDAGMRLEIDATVLYAMGEWKDRVTYADLEVESPYNTYQIAGLPVGPICSMGKAALEAVIEPADTQYYYYVLKPDGTGAHNFAEDYNTFLVYKDQYLRGY